MFDWAEPFMRTGRWLADSDTKRPTAIDPNVELNCKGTQEEKNRTDDVDVEVMVLNICCTPRDGSHSAWLTTLSLVEIFARHLEKRLLEKKEEEKGHKEPPTLTIS